jgi:hypothetical protein
VNAAGIVLILAGVWVLAQVLKGGALDKLGV